MKLILIAVLTVLTAGCVCIPCEGAELFSSPPARIVQVRGPWVLVERNGECCWLYDSCYATRRLATTGKKVLKDTVNVIGCTVETAGDIVIGAGALVIGTGHEILQRTHCAVKCLICPRPKPKPPEVREEDLKPPTILIPEDDGKKESPATVHWRLRVTSAR
jgi:hypothetical protein